MSRKIGRTVAAFSALLLPLTLVFSVATASENDSASRDLLQAILTGDSDAFENAVALGADPNRIFGRFDDEWAMCAATQEGKEKYLARLISIGGDPNLVNEEAGFSDEYPATCAMINGNKVAFDVLIESGANPNALTCRGCGPERQDSLFIAAIGSATFDIALELLHLTTVSEDDLVRLASILESRRTRPGSDTARITWKFADYLRERGIDVNPAVPRP